ncbi:insulinase family protein, partial [Escherichia coli]|nr:insulinase family protein [Escherichia coli]
APNNAVLSISGAFDSITAKELVNRFFGDISSQAAPPPVDVSEPPEVAENYKKYEDKLAPFPAFLIGWKIPPRRTRK